MTAHSKPTTTYPPPGRGRRRTAADAGFTLIEIGVVIVLIGLMMGIVAPKIGVETGATLKTEARRLAGTIRYLYSDAVFSKTELQLRYDFEKGSYGVIMSRVDQAAGTVEQVEVDSEQAEATTSESGTVELPEGIKFRDVITLREGKKSEGQSHTLFFIHGFVEPTTIHLMDDAEHELTLYVHPLTGKVEIYDGYMLVSGEGSTEEF